jgi:hypothetical protein
MPPYHMFCIQFIHLSPSIDSSTMLDVTTNTHCIEHMHMLMYIINNITVINQAIKNQMIL